jgi:hypothetical protein
VSRFLLVELHEDLAAHYQTRAGAWRLIKQVPGVHTIEDLAEISQATLDAILRPPSPDLERMYQRSKKPKRKESGWSDAVGSVRG